MAFEITIPFYTIQMKFKSDVELSSPMLDRNVLRINKSLEVLAGKYANELQRKILDNGQLHRLIEETKSGTFQKDILKLEFKASKDKISFPAFELEFDFFYTESERGFWGVVPAVAVESFGEWRYELIENLSEAIRLEFVRNRRLAQVHKIVAAIWWGDTSLTHSELTLMAPNPKEIEETDSHYQELFLTKVAYRLNESQVQLFGREKEMEQFQRAAFSKFSRNVLLVGASGVGKTAMVRELSRLMEDGDQSIWHTTASTLIKECTGDTGWQENLAILCEELKQTDDFLYLPNLMELFEVGQYQGNSVSMAVFLTSYLSRGEISLISECTEEELAKIDLKQPNYLSLFQIIRLEEPKEKLEEIIINKVNLIADARSLKVERRAIEETLRLNKRFTPYSGLPGKPIRFLESLIIDEGKKLKGKAIDRKQVVQAFSEESGLPLFMIDPEIPMDTNQIKSEFNSNVYGQEKAVSAVVDMLASVKTALARTGQPIASFLFVGPTGVGKTEMARVLTQFMFGSRDRMVRFDMSEFSSGYAMSRLIGESYTSGGLLTSAVRQNPFCVLLFDEIEKSHPSVYDLFLQILGEGRLTDPSGKIINFCSTIIIMTSNIGADNMMGNRISFSDKLNKSEISESFKTAVQRFFRPELYNRFDQIIPFEPLDADTMRFVVEREVQLLKNREGISFRKMDFTIDDAVLYYLAEKGYDVKYGARQLQRSIRDEITGPLAQALNSYSFDDQLIVKIGIKDRQPDIHIEADPLGVDLFFEELDKITNADYASELRRKMNQLQEGNFYIRLLSQVDILTNEERRTKTEFWKNLSKSKRYTNLLATKNKTDLLEKRIVKIENDHALSVLGMGQFTEQMNQELEAWKEDFKLLKMEIYGRMAAGANVSFLYIYGFQLKPIIEFYQTILDAKDFDYEFMGIWHRHPSGSNGDGSEEEEENPQVYFFNSVDKGKELRFRPEMNTDILCGALIRIDGPCANLFFSGETYVGAWWLDEKEKITFNVEVKDKMEAPPMGIHRKEYYKGNANRIVRPGHFKDLSLAINREIPKGDFLKVLMTTLEDRFKFLLDQAIT